MAPDPGEGEDGSLQVPGAYHQCYASRISQAQVKSFVLEDSSIPWRALGYWQIDQTSTLGLGNVLGAGECGGRGGRDSRFFGYAF